MRQSFWLMCYNSCTRSEWKKETCSKNSEAGKKTWLIDLIDPIFLLFAQSTPDVVD
jgi:hypothetical protein